MKDDVKRDDGDKFRFISPEEHISKKPSRPMPFKPVPEVYSEADEDEGWVRHDIQQQISDTLEVFKHKELSHGDEIFYVLALSSKPSRTDVSPIFKKLSAKVLAYLNQEHTRILVSASNQGLYNLQDRVPVYFKKGVYLLKPLSENYRLGNELKTLDPDTAMKLFIKIMPNLDKQTNRLYVRKVKRYLKTERCQIIETQLSKEGVVVTKAPISAAQRLISNSTFIYKVNAAPKARAQMVVDYLGNSAKEGGEIIHLIQPNASTSYAHFPFIAVLDSGVNEILPLRRILLRFPNPRFPNQDDGIFNEGNGHGTPIAYLAAYGEEQNACAKIISYKIISDEDNTVSYDSIIEAIERFANDSRHTRLFVSSVAFEFISDDDLLRLDRLVQRKNICYVCSAGNIRKDEIMRCLTNGRNYPLYLMDFHVLPPANAPNILSVGSVSKRVNPNGLQRSLARSNEIAPHSRCGHDIPSLYDCLKPEVVEHGGNVNFNTDNLNCYGVGVSSYNRLGLYVDNLVGTSFSAPIFARRLAEIESVYRMIKNSETLKAISVISCQRIPSNCAGFGESTSFTKCDNNHYLYVAEGKINLNYKQGGFIYTPYHRISNVIVPKGIGSIEVCLVHSDNFSKTISPTLNTELVVSAWKLASHSPVSPVSTPVTRERTNIKVLRYSFIRKEMESIWRFDLVPEVISKITSEDMKLISVRYGCAILLTRKPNYVSSRSVSEQIDDFLVKSEES